MTLISAGSVFFFVQSGTVTTTEKSITLTNFDLGLFKDGLKPSARLKAGQTKVCLSWGDPVRGLAQPF